jgi:hypothetical protein
LIGQWVHHTMTRMWGVDGLNATNKLYLTQKMSMICTPVENENKNHHALWPKKNQKAWPRNACSCVWTLAASLVSNLM